MLIIELKSIQKKNPDYRSCQLKDNLITITTAMIKLKA